MGIFKHIQKQKERYGEHPYSSHPASTIMNKQGLSEKEAFELTPEASMEGNHVLSKGKDMSK